MPIIPTNHAITCTNIEVIKESREPWFRSKLVKDTLYLILKGNEHKNVNHKMTAGV